MALEDLGFDFSDEHDDFDVVNTVFSADDNAAKRESSPPRDNNQEHSTIPNRQHNETQVNGKVDHGISVKGKMRLTLYLLHQVLFRMIKARMRKRQGFKIHLKNIRKKIRITTLIHPLVPMPTITMIRMNILNQQHLKALALIL